MRQVDYGNRLQRGGGASRGQGEALVKVVFVAPGAPAWTVAADFIAGAFARRYGAQVAVAAIPLAVAVRADGRLAGAAGLRSAAEGFFSECYLDAPVATALSRAAGRLVHPEQVIEVVSLACVSPVVTLPLVDAIVGEGRRRGMSWGLFTGTSHLARRLARAGAPLLRLAPAAARMRPDRAVWGSYYATDPWVYGLADTGRSLSLGSAATAPRPLRTRPAETGFSSCA
jgi:hypothetical protein